MKLIVNLIDKTKKIEEVIKYSHDNDVGADVILQEDVHIKPGMNQIPLGFSIILPSGIAGFIYPRSSIMGLNLQFNLAPIDPDYSGVWKLVLYNSGEEIIFSKGTRICQIVLLPFVQAEFVTNLNNRRDFGGLGSTGV